MLKNYTRKLVFCFYLLPLLGVFSACQEKITLPEDTVTRLKEKYPDSILCFFGRQAFGAESEKYPKRIDRHESNPVKLMYIDNAGDGNVKQYIDSVLLFFNGVSNRTRFEYTTSFADADAVLIFLEKRKRTHIMPVFKLFSNRLSKEICYMYQSYNQKYVVYHELFHMFSGVGRNCFYPAQTILSDFPLDKKYTRYYAIDSIFADIMLNFDIPSGLTLRQYEKQLGIQCGTREEDVAKNWLVYDSNIKRFTGDTLSIYRKK